MSGVKIEVEVKRSGGARSGGSRRGARTGTTGSIREGHVVAVAVSRDHLELVAPAGETLRALAPVPVLIESEPCAPGRVPKGGSMYTRSMQAGGSRRSTSRLSARKTPSIWANNKAAPAARQGPGCRALGGPPSGSLGPPLGGGPIPAPGSASGPPGSSGRRGSRPRLCFWPARLLRGRWPYVPPRP